MKITAGVLLALVLLIAAAPTLIGTRPILSIILGQVNGKLNGHVEIDSLSLGWFSGTEIKGVRVFDQANAQIAEIDRLSVPLPLIKVITGNYALGDVVCDGLSADAKLDTEHQLNFDQLLKKTPPPPGTPQSPVPATSTPPPTPPVPPEAPKASRLPAISGNIKLTHARLSFSQPGKPTAYLSNIEGEIKIPSINDPITDSLSLTLRSGNGPEGNFKTSGTVAMVKDNIVELKTADIHQTWEASNIDLAAAKPFLPSSSKLENLAGLLGAHVAIDLTGGKDVGVKTDIDLQSADAKGVLTPVDAIHESFTASYLGGIDLRQIHFTLASKTINGEFTGKTLADLNGSLNANFDALSAELQRYLTSELSLGGQLSCAIVSAGQVGKSHLSVGVHGNNLRYGTITEPYVELGAQADLIGDTDHPATTLKQLQIGLRTGNSSTPGIDLAADAPEISLADPSAAALHLAHLIVDLPKLQTEFAAVPPKTAGTIINSGTLTISASAAMKDKMMSLDDLAIHIDNFAATQQSEDGKQGDPIVGGSMAMTGSASKTGDLIKAKFNGNVAELCRMLAAYQGKNADAYPYRGNYSLTENITTGKDLTALQGGLQIANFQSLSGSTVSFTDQLLAIANDITLANDGGDKSITIGSLTVDAQQTHAIKLVIKNGTIQHLATRRDLNLQPALDYDLAQLWPIVQPIMGDKYKTLKITGQFSKQFNITGSYPANQLSTVAIKTLHADGDLAVASFDYDGLNLQNFIVPFTLDAGQLRTVYFGKPQGQNLAPAAIANGGTLDPSDLTIDLTQSPPRLTAPANKVVIANLTVNPLFANTFLKNYLNNPVFTGNSASGLFGLTIVDCTQVPMGDLLNQPIPANTGKTDLHFTLTNFHIGVNGISGLASVLKQDSFVADVKDGSISIATGLAKEHMSFVTGPYAIAFDGTVRLLDEALIPMNMNIGPLPAFAQKVLRVHDQKILNSLPAKFTVPVKGTVSHASVDGGALAKEIVKASAAGGLKSLINGDQNGNSPLNGLLNKLK